MNANTTNDANIIYPELSYRMVGIAFKVQNDLGRFCKENQYANAFEEELKSKAIHYQREFYVPIQVSNAHIGKNWIDFLIDECLVIELKAKPFILKEDYYQTQRYLHLLNMKLGLIINFRNKYLYPKRVFNSQYSQDS